MYGNLPPKIYQILTKAVNGDIENFDICVHDPNKKGEGYLGEIFFVSLRNNNDGKELNFVVKQAFSEKNIRDFHPIREVFLNEIYFYEHMWPKLQSFQERIPPLLRFVHLAKYYSAVSEENFEGLVLENLRYEGYMMHDKKKPVEKSKFEYIFKVYGMFHAVSFAYKVSHPEEFSWLTSGLSDVWTTFSQNKIFQNSIKLLHEQCLECFDYGADDAVIQKYTKYVDDGVKIFSKSLVDGEYSCLIHGDSWSNNMMFKYDETNHLTDLRLWDFQTVRYGSPVCDLSYCLYSGGTKEILEDFDHLLQVYHDSLSESLRAYGCDPDNIYPLEAIKKHWKLYSQLGIAMGLTMWRCKVTYDEDMVDLSDLLDDEGDITKLFEANYDKKAFRQITRDIIHHLFENNYLF